MKIIKRILLSIFVLLVLTLLVLRIIQVSHSNDVSYRFGKKIAEEMGIKAGEYLPLNSQIKINDSTIFYPGYIFLQHPVEMKHRFFIFSEYFEKKPIPWKDLYYESKDKKNEHSLVLTINRSDSTLNQMLSWGTSDLKDNLEFYSLNDDELLDTKNRRFDTRNIKHLDTIKFYIKKAYLAADDRFSSLNGKVKPYDSSMNSQILLQKEPLDSLLYYKVNKR